MGKAKRTETIEEIQERLERKKRAERRRIREVGERIRQRAEERKEAVKKEQAAKRKASQDKLQEQRAEAFDRKHKGAALRAWLTTGGSREAFEKAWPKMREEIRQEVIEAEMGRRQRSTEREYQGRF